MGDHVHELQHFSHHFDDMNFLAALLSPNTYPILSG